MSATMRMWIGEHVKVETKEIIHHGILRFVDDTTLGLTTMMYHKSEDAGGVKLQFIKGYDEDKVNLILPLNNVEYVQRVTATPLG